MSQYANEVEKLRADLASMAAALAARDAEIDRLTSIEVPGLRTLENVVRERNAARTDLAAERAAHAETRREMEAMRKDKGWLTTNLADPEFRRLYEREMIEQEAAVRCEVEVERDTAIARAEQAERERDAALDTLDGNIEELRYERDLIVIDLEAHKAALAPMVKALMAMKSPCAEHCINIRPSDPELGLGGRCSCGAEDQNAAIDDVLAPDLVQRAVAERQREREDLEREVRVANGGLAVVNAVNEELERKLATATAALARAHEVLHKLRAVCASALPDEPTPAGLISLLTPSILADPTGFAAYKERKREREELEIAAANERVVSNGLREDLRGVQKHYAVAGAALARAHEALQAAKINHGGMAGACATSISDAECDCGAAGHNAAIDAAIMDPTGIAAYAEWQRDKQTLEEMKALFEPITDQVVRIAELNKDARDYHLCVIKLGIEDVRAIAAYLTARNPAPAAKE